MDILSEINRTGITVLVVTHDQEVASRTQRTIRLRDGQVVDSVISGTNTPHIPTAGRSPATT